MKPRTIFMIVFVTLLLLGLSVVFILLTKNSDNAPLTQPTYKEPVVKEPTKAEQIAEQQRQKLNASIPPPIEFEEAYKAVEKQSPYGNVAVCGDNVCALSEDCVTCASDCGCSEDSICQPDYYSDIKGCMPLDEYRKFLKVRYGDPTGKSGINPEEAAKAHCGDGVCYDYEDCSNCPADCGCTQDQVCYPNADHIENGCVDRTKFYAGYDASAIKTDPVCGDNICSVGESCNLCTADCDCPTEGDI